MDIEEDRRTEGEGNELISQEHSESDENDRSCINLCGLASCISRQKKTKRKYSQREVAAVTQNPQNGLFIQISEQTDQEEGAVNIDANAGVCIEGPRATETAVIPCSQALGKFFLPRVTSVTGGQKEAEERLLSQAVGHHTSSHSRFLTLRRLRRRKPPTRALQKYSALLDDIYHGPTQCVLQQVGEWDFNAFVLDSMCGGRPVTVLCTYLLHCYGLLRSFKLDFASVWKCFSLIEDGYHSSNPYHNAIHAADVTQAMHCYLQEYAICSSLTTMEQLAAIIGAVCHDLDHPGVNQPFLIATDNHLAVLYNNASVLENHHWRCAMSCLWESGILNSWTSQDVQLLQEMIRSLILATDITRQNEFITSFKKYLDTGTLDMRKAECRHFSLQIALKCADICNPCRPWDVCRHWAEKICDEFYRQGDYERQLNLPVTPLCDRHNNTVAKIQIGFIKFVVQPLFESWDCWLSTCLSKYMLSNLKQNLLKWEQEILYETETNIPSEEPVSTHEKVKITVSAYSESSASSDESGRSILGSLSCMSHPLLLRRRHSLPTHASCFLPRTVIRRESLSGAGNPMLVYETISRGESPPSSVLSLRKSDYFFSPLSDSLDEGGVVRRQSFPLQSPNYHGNQALRFVSPPTPLHEESTSCTTSREIVTEEDKKQKKTTTGCTDAGDVSERSQPHCQKQSANDKNIQNVVSTKLKADHSPRRVSLESGAKRDASQDSSLCCKKNKTQQESSLDKPEGKLLHKKSNKENKPPDRSIWKKRLWKSLNYDDSYSERSPLLASPQSQSFTNRRRGSAPVIRVEELRKSVRVFENPSDFISKRRGSAPNRIYIGGSSPVLARKVGIESERLTIRRGSAPTSGTFVESRTITIAPLKAELHKSEVSSCGTFCDLESHRLHFSQRERFSPSLEGRRSSYGFELLSGIWRCKYERSKPFLLSEDSILLSSGSCTPITPGPMNATPTTNFSEMPFELPIVYRRGSLPTDVYNCGGALIPESDSS